MKKNILFVLLSLMCLTSYSQETINHQINYIVRPTFSNQPISTLTELASTNSGSEGITKIGAFGGYELDELIEDISLKGPTRDLPTFTYTYGWSPAPSLIVSWTTGDVYDPDYVYKHLVPGTNTLIDNSVNYAYWSTNSPNVIQWTTGIRPDPNTTIYLAEFSTAFGAIINAKITTSVGDLPLQTADGHSAVMPSLIASGMLVYPTGTNLTNIAVTSGIEYQDMSKRNTHDSQDLGNTNITQGMLVYSHTNVSLWGWMLTNRFPIGQWDNGTNVIACDTSKWYRGIFVSLAQQPFINYVMPHAEYTNYAEAVAADDPDLPPGFDPYVPKITAYVFSGQDDSLRTESTYWLDRRFMIRRGTLSTGGGSSGSTPTLEQVLVSGRGTGGILPNGAGFPTANDELASKGYVDSTINNINQQQAYVDKNGNDATAQIQSSILPFKTIQAAIDAAAVVANNTNRFNIRISPGVYLEDVVMKDYISIGGNDIESTVINGSVTYPHAYTDIVGAEISLLTITSSNKPALSIDPGADDAYIGVRSCSFNTSFSDDTITNKSVVLIYRGLAEIYATTYLDLEVLTTNGPIQHSQIFEHKTDFANQGLSQLTSIGSSCIINSYDVNDDVSLMLTHTNNDANCINTIQGGVFNVHLDLLSDICSNNFKLVSHRKAIGRTLVQGIVTRLYLPTTNNCNLFIGYCQDGIGDNVTISRNNHIRIVGGTTSNIWLGTAISTNDTLRVLDTEYIQNLSDYPYPTIYTNNGSAGKYFINTPHANGDHLFGSALDVSTINSTTVSTPQTGHLKLYANSYAGLENPMFKDSSGNIARICRDNFYNGFNDDTNAMNVGDAVYISPGLSANNTPKVKKCIANDISTLPCAGLVSQIGGIATGSIGRIMIMGRLENTLDTSSFTSGQKIYVSDTIKGGLTNVAPSGSSYAQIVATAHLIGTNGYLNVRPWSPDSLGNLPPASYATTNWASGSNNTINAQTIQGYTPHQLTAATATYYIWGSLAGSFTNPASKIAKLDSPYGQPVWTSIITGASVTNGLFLGYACLKTNETPRFMEGKNDIHIQIERDGDGSDRTMEVYRSIYENNQTTIVETVKGGIHSIPNYRSDLTYTIAPTSTVNIVDYDRLVVYYFRLVSGWTGTETIKVYSQNGELTYISLASAPGVYVPTEEYRNDRVGWDSASNWVTSSSSGVAVVFSNTSNWNNATTRLDLIEANTSNWNYATNWVISNSGNVAYATNWVISNSGNVAYATNWVISNSGNVAIVFSNTSNWNRATTRLDLVESNTSNWNRATNWVTSNSNNLNSLLSPIRFKAGLQTNMTLLTGTGKFMFTNVLLAASGGSEYTATNSRWYPRTTGKVIEFMGGHRIDTVQINTVHSVILYKNGSEYVTLFSYRASNSADAFTITWNFAETVNTSTNDYYEVWYVSGNASTTVNASTNNWWYGEAK